MKILILVGNLDQNIEMLYSYQLEVDKLVLVVVVVLVLMLVEMVEIRLPLNLSFHLVRNHLLSYSLVEIFLLDFLLCLLCFLWLLWLLCLLLNFLLLDLSLQLLLNYLHFENHLLNL